MCDQVTGNTLVLPQQEPHLFETTVSFDDNLKEPSHKYVKHLNHVTRATLLSDCPCVNQHLHTCVLVSAQCYKVSEVCLS